MRAMLLTGFDGPSSYQPGEVERPPLGARDVAVAPRASALNHLDLWVSRGLPKPPLPHVAGADCAGVVTGVGADVSLWKEGDEVVIDPSLSCGQCPECATGEIVYCDHFGILGEHHWGVFADEVVVPEVNIHARPANLSWEQAAAYPLTYVTAWRMLKRAGLRAGHDLLVVGAGAGVSAAAIAIGVGAGARVYATSRSEAKQKEAVEMGAVAAYDSAEFAKAVKAATGGKGADISVDHVGPATLDQTLAATAKGGAVTICGSTSGTKVEITVPRLFFRQHRIIGSTMGTHAEFAEVTRMVSEGVVAPPAVDSTFALTDLPAALERLDRGEQFGKVVLTPEPT